MAIQYDKGWASELASKARPGYYPIKHYMQMSDFEVLNYGEISSNCSKVKGKIVIVGSLGPGGKDIFETEVADKSLGRTYGTVILANISN